MTIFDQYKGYDIKIEGKKYVTKDQQEEINKGIDSILESQDADSVPMVRPQLTDNFMIQVWPGMGTIEVNAISKGE